MEHYQHWKQAPPTQQSGYTAGITHERKGFLQVIKFADVFSTSRWQYNTEQILGKQGKNFCQHATCMALLFSSGLLKKWHKAHPLHVIWSVYGEWLSYNTKPQAPLRHDRSHEEENWIHLHYIQLLWHLTLKLWWFTISEGTCGLQKGV